VITVLPNTAVPPPARPPVTQLPSAGDGGLYSEPTNIMAIAMIAGSVICLSMLGVSWLFDAPQPANRYRRRR
jgi:hypothetical protein